MIIVQTCGLCNIGSICKRILSMPIGNHSCLWPASGLLRGCTLMASQWSSQGLYSYGQPVVYSGVEGFPRNPLWVNAISYSRVILDYAGTNNNRTPSLSLCKFETPFHKSLIRPCQVCIYDRSAAGMHDTTP